MSAIMRRRRSLIGLSLIEGSCPEVGVLELPILRTGRPPRHPLFYRSVGWRDPRRLLLSRASGFVQCPTPVIRDPGRIGSVGWKADLRLSHVLPRHASPSARIKPRGCEPARG